MMVSDNTNVYSLKIGDVVIGIECPSCDYMKSMEEYFDTKSVSKNPDILIKMNIVLHQDKPKIPDSLYLTKEISPEGFSMAGDLVKGYFEPLERKGEIWVKNILTKAPITRIFEQILYQAFYSARNVCNYDAFLIHSSGVIKNNAGYLFVGTYDAGKTTVANLSADYHVLNDEICLVSFIGENAYLHSTPFNGLYMGKREGSTPLKAVLFLKHGKAHKLLELSRTEAVITLTREIVPPIGIEEGLSHDTKDSMLKLADRLSRNVPFRLMEFKQDPGFWDVIDSEFK
ncbi:MAG: hypothetical protein JXB48_05590 [Candidatus Latescibacteria bacterium]|nr:hypothetical protein [Candidatus Latescibacterota bacterium]